MEKTVKFIGGFVSALALLCGGSAEAAQYTVKQDGSGAFTTIQACVNAAQPGDTCLVAAGSYGERVNSARSGTVSQRITIVGEGADVATKGFSITHNYITVRGFHVTNETALYTGCVYVAGDYVEVLNNTIDTTTYRVYGIMFEANADYATVTGNTLTNIHYPFLAVNGTNHLFEGNTFRELGAADFVRVFGSGHVFRRNIFRDPAPGAGGGHPDFVQNFGGSGLVSHDILFEYNWMSNIPAQFMQLKSGDSSINNCTLYPDLIRNIVFRRNIIVNQWYKGNWLMPGVTFDHNTTYRIGVLNDPANFGVGGSTCRGSGPTATLTNNVFLANGQPESTSTGWYGWGDGLFSFEGVASSKVTGEYPLYPNLDPPPPIAQGIWDSMVANGYIQNEKTGSRLLTATDALTSLDGFTLDPAYATYKAAVYAQLIGQRTLRDASRATFRADYNYVAGAGPTYAAKQTVDCLAPGAYVDRNFCEVHGINGGDPSLANLADPLGPDGVPFTLDDGLKPLPTSRLCGAGEGGTDIGAYSCDPARVFPGETSPPSNLRIIR